MIRKFPFFRRDRKPRPHPVKEALAPNSYEIALSETKKEVAQDRLELEELEREILQLKDIHVKVLTNVELSVEEAKSARLLRIEED